MTIHPKTSGAGLGGALGVAIVAILHAIPGVHLPADVYGAIAAALSAGGAFLAPALPAADAAQIGSLFAALGALRHRVATLERRAAGPAAGADAPPVEAPAGAGEASAPVGLDALAGATDLRLP